MLCYQKLKTENPKPSHYEKREFWARLQRNRMAMTGLVLVLGLFAVALLAPWLAPYDPNLH